MPAEVNNSAHNLTIESHFSVEVKGKLGAMDSKCVIIKNLLMLSVRISRSVCRDAHGKFGEHERCVRVA